MIDNNNIIDTVNLYLNDVNNEAEYCNKFNIDFYQTKLSNDIKQCEYIILIMVSDVLLHIVINIAQCTHKLTYYKGEFLCLKNCIGHTILFHVNHNCYKFK